MRTRREAEDKGKDEDKEEGGGREVRYQTRPDGWVAQALVVVAVAVAVEMEMAVAVVGRWVWRWR